MRKLFTTFTLAVFIAFFSISVCAAVNPLDKKNTGSSATVIKPGQIRIPTDYGRITEVFDRGGNKLVIHMQDAHTNYGAQKNAAAIIEDLINKYGLYLILVEGGSRDVSLNRYREQFPKEKRKEIAEESLKNGVIAGEEYLNIISDYPMKLQGIEDRPLYDQNMTAFLDIDKDRDVAILFTRLLSSVVSNLKTRIYTRALKELDEKRIEFKQETNTLNDYLYYLDSLVRSRKINIASYGSYTNLITVLGLEKEIDFPTVEKERADVIDLLSKKVGRDELSQLLANSVDFKTGKLSQAQYHIYLKDLMKKSNVNINKYPNLENYVKYIIIYDDMDSPSLFSEIKKVEADVENSLASNEEQKRLLQISKNLELLLDFINLKLSPDDFDYYIKHEGDFNIAVWARFLNSQSERFNFSQMIPEDNQAIEKIIPALKSFYTIARKRDDVFLANANKYMDEEGVNIAVLIAGGFHTPTLMQLFRKSNISYVVVAPKVIKATDEKLYHKILTEGWAPSEGTE